MPALLFSAALPIGAGLSFGLTPALIGLLLGSLALAISQGYILAVIYLIVDAIPSIIIIGLNVLYQKKQTKNPIGKMVSWANLFVSACLAGLCMLLINTLAAKGIETPIKEEIQSFLINGISVPENKVTEAHAFIKHIAPFFIYLLSISWITHILLGASIGELIARKIKTAIKKPDFINFRVPNWSITLIPVFAILGIISDANIRFIGINIALALTTPLTLQGLAYCHKKVANIRFSSALLLFFYVLLARIEIKAVAALCILGLVEHFSNGGVKKSTRRINKQEN